MRARHLRIGAALVVAWLACVSAVAQNVVGSGVYGDVKISGSGYTGPGDIQSYVAWWGLRCYNSAYSGNVADIWDAATGNTTETLLTCSAGGTINQTIHPLATTCASSCVVAKLYDQTGNNACENNSVSGFSCDVSQATNANRPTLTVSCQNGHPCVVFSGASSQQLLIQGGANATGLTSAVAQPWSVSGVVERTGNFTTFQSTVSFGHNNITAPLGFGASANTIALNAGSTVTAAGTDNAWNAVQSVANGSSSTIRVNGTTTSSLNPGTRSIPNFQDGTNGFGHIGSDGFGDFTTGEFAEGGILSGAMSSGNQSSTEANERAYWSF